MPLPPGAVERPGSAFRGAVQLFSVPGQTIAFDALVNQLISIHVDPGPLPPGAVGFRGAVAVTLAAGTNVPSLFSALTHQWHAVPAGTRAEMPWLTQDAALLRTTTGMAAFAARSGRFVPLAGPGLVGHLQDNVFAVHGGGAVHFFDPRTERWLSAPAATGPVQGQVLDTNVMLIPEVGRTTAFGARSGRLESLPVSTTWHPIQILGDIVVVHTSTQVLAFTGLPENLSWFDFPLGQHACGLGTTYRHQLRLGAGSVALQGFGLRAVVPVTLPPFGELWLDATATDVRFVMAAPGEERVLSEVPVPMAPSLHGSEWWQQSLVLPPSGVPYLTSVEWLWIL